MKLYEYTEALRTPPSAVMLGKFDGMHTGHQGLLRCMKEEALPYQRGLLTFDFSCAADSFLDHGQLFTKKEREKIAAAYGFNWMIRLPFTDKIRTMLPEVFFRKILMQQCSASAVYVGEDYRFGYMRQGDAAMLQRLCQAEGVHFRAIPEIQYENEKISSSRLRALVLKGKLDETRAMLGYPFFVNGTIVHGKHIGRTISFPTANLLWEEGKLLPPIGVYDTYSLLKGKGYFGITNIGNNPTVRTDKENPLSVETHLLDFSETVYGEEMQTFFLRKTREQKTFSGLPALRGQLEEDKSNLKENCEKYNISDISRFEMEEKR